MSKRISSFLDTNQGLRQLSRKIAQLRALQRQYEQGAPSALVRASRVMQLEQQILTISADNGAVATKLRQIAPNLAQMFQDGGHEVTGIQVRVQVTSPPETYRSPPATVSATGQQRLADLAEQLPDSPLKNALRRLAKDKKLL